MSAPPPSPHFWWAWDAPSSGTALVSFSYWTKPSCLSGPCSWGLRGREAAHSWTGRCVVLTLVKEAASLTIARPQPLSPTKSLPLLGFRLQFSGVGKTPEWSFSRQRTPPRTLCWALTPVPRLSRPVEEVLPPRSELVKFVRCSPGCKI